MSPILIVLLYSISVLLFPFVFHFWFVILVSSHLTHPIPMILPHFSYFVLIVPTPIDILLFLLRLLRFFLFVTSFLVIMHRRAGLLHSHQRMALALVLCYFDVAASFLCSLMYKRTSVVRLCTTIHLGFIPKVSLQLLSLIHLCL